MQTTSCRAHICSSLGRVTRKPPTWPQLMPAFYFLDRLRLIHSGNAKTASRLLPFHSKYPAPRGDELEGVPEIEFLF